MIARSCVLLALSCALANAQFVQQGGKLVATDAIGYAQQGSSVAVSADGNTAIVGGPDDGDNLGEALGAAWVYTRSGGVWTQQGGRLVGIGAMNGQYGAYQGYSVALSADGNTAILGGFGDNGNAGAAWVFTRSGGVWTQQGRKLVGTGAIGGAEQGYSVALSADGNTALVGGYGDNNDAGAGWVFTRSAGIWSQQAKIVGSGAAGTAGQGQSVALSADGNTAMMGGPDDNNDAGAVWVFTRSGGMWTQQGGKLVGTDAANGDRSDGVSQGSSVALSADGNTAIVGGPNDNNRAGAAWVYTRTDGVWTQQGSKLVGTGAATPYGASQGYSVALSADGNTAVVSAPYGPVSVFVRSDGVWTQQGGSLVGIGAVGNAEQGYSVALSGDGNTVIVGGPNDNPSPSGAHYGAGAAWVFVAPGGENLAPAIGTPAATSTASGATLEVEVNPNGLDTQVWFLYGTDSSMTAAIATPQQDIGWGTVALPVTADIGGLTSWTTYYFQAWAQRGAAVFCGSIQTFVATPPPTVDAVEAASVTGSGIVLGAIVGASGLDTHAWFLYSTNSSMRGALSTTTQDIGAATSQVPISATITGLATNTTYYFRAAAQNSVGTTEGPILSFSTQFTGQNGKLLGTDVAGNAGQGSSVALSADGNTALVGGPNDNNRAGAAWVYTRSGGVWTQQGGKLVGADVTGAATQGTSVALSADGNTAIVGGPDDDGTIGAAWVYTRSGGVWTQQGSKLVGSGAVGNAYQGLSVAISADGNTALVGGPDDNKRAGAAWVYTRSGGVWMQQGDKLVGTGAVIAAYQGSSVALSGDGNTAIVGGPGDLGAGDDLDAGAAWVYTRAGGGWTQQGSKLVGTGAIGSAYQGTSLALSGDGNTAIVCGPYDNGQGSSAVGAAWAYTRAGGVWSQQGDKLVGAGEIGIANQGTSVALSADGNMAIVGGLHDLGPYPTWVGAAWVYTRSGGVWGQEGGQLAGGGDSVAISAEGDTVIIGGSEDNNGAGAAWVFVREPGTPWRPLRPQRP
jgi:hypothetical protein